MSSSNVEKHLDLLGLPVKDKVTGQKGVVDSICFDLYGCVQASINAGLDEKGKQKSNIWFDVSRLKVTENKRVMDKPDFKEGPVAEGLHGPAEKPSM